MISIITAIHNGLAFNKIFEESLRKYTVSKYELIIIDNVSTDGSKEYFMEKGHVVIPNDKNYSYPVCQNQGINVAKGEVLFFLNNDLILSPKWDERLMEAARLHDIDIISACGIENLGDVPRTRKNARRWKLIKPTLKIFGFGENNLRLMSRLMYGNWEKFCETIFKKYQYEVVEGIVGNNVMMTRKALQLIGPWDERLQVADFDIFMRAKKRSLESKDMKPCYISRGVYIHHYIRMTSKSKKKPTLFADANNLISLDKKWSATEQREMHPDKVTSQRMS